MRLLRRGRRGGDQEGRTRREGVRSRARLLAENHREHGLVLVCSLGAFDAASFLGVRPAHGREARVDEAHPVGGACAIALLEYEIARAPAMRGAGTVGHPT